MNQHTKQYAFDGIPGCVSTIVSKNNGVLVSLGRGPQLKNFGKDFFTPPWVLYCCKHGQYGRYRKLSLAKADMSCPESWCRDCQNELLLPAVPKEVRDVLDHAADVATEAARIVVRRFSDIRLPSQDMSTGYFYKYGCDCPGIPLKDWHTYEHYKTGEKTYHDCLPWLGDVCGTARIEIPLTVQKLKPFFKEMFSKNREGNQKYNFENQSYGVWTDLWSLYVKRPTSCDRCITDYSTNRRVSCGACTLEGCYEIRIKHAFRYAISMPMFNVELAAHEASAEIIRQNISKKFTIKHHID